MPRISTWPGRDVRRLKGVVRQRSPSSIPHDSFHHLENVDWQGVILKDRPGQAKVNSAGAMAAKVDFMFDARDIGVPVVGSSLFPSFFPGAASSCTAFGSERLYIIGGGNAGNEAVPYYYDGTTLAALGTPADGQTDVMIFIPGGTCLIVGTNPYGGAPAFAEIRKLSPSTGGTTAWFTLGDITARIDSLLYVTPTEEGGPDGLLIGVAFTSASAFKPGVYVTRNASTVTLERETDNAIGNDAQSHIHLTKTPAGVVYVSMWDNPTSDNYGLFVRAAGGGSYTRIPIDDAAGQIDSGSHNGIEAKGVHATANAEEGNPHVYLFGRGVASQAAMIGIYPGQTEPTKVQFGRSFGAAGSAKGVHTAEDFNGFVYFGYGNDAGLAQLAKVAWSSGSPVWTNIEYSFTAGAGSGDSIDTCVALRAWNGSLYALCLDTTAPQKAFLYKSDGTDTTVWTRIGELVNAGLGAYNLNQSANRHMQVA